ncbi:hypothetical protein Syun_017300 [Stephania yunnanensis]|uniref:Uncharacterized protein n=1 Tax=Stephania yunnanensis TaxID=152371 RepID=A0AAP0J6S8_9MAGN
MDSSSFSLGSLFVFNFIIYVSIQSGCETIPTSLRVLKKFDSVEAISEGASIRSDNRTVKKFGILTLSLLAHIVLRETHIKVDNSKETKRY